MLQKLEVGTGSVGSATILLDILCGSTILPPVDVDYGPIAAKEDEMKSCPECYLTLTLLLLDEEGIEMLYESCS